MSQDQSSGNATLDASTQRSNNEHDRHVRRWRVRIFIATYLAYVGYYLTRKNLPVVQPAMIEEFGWTIVEVGLIATVFQATYATGQLVMGALGDRLGARRMLLWGMSATVLLSLASGFAASVPLLVVIWAANGFAQATGWPAAVKTIAAWFPRRIRGRIMGWWTTNYQVGDTLATWITTVSLTAFGWRWGFKLPALALGLIIILVALWHRNDPADVGIDLERNGATGAIGVTSANGNDRQFHFRDVSRVVRMPALWAMALISGSLKFAMYVFFFWTVTYLVDEHGFGFVRAGTLAALIPLGGVVGAVTAGWASDRFFDSRRMPIGVLMPALLTAVVVVIPFLPSDPWLLGVTFFVVGFAIYGPESLIAGAGAVELAPPGTAATAVGFVNAIASLSGVPAGVLTALVAEAYGWSSVYIMLGVVTSFAALGSLPLWNLRGNN
jgi:sugar phosphate permease